jgi:hypothetical protein
MEEIDSSFGDIITSELEVASPPAFQMIIFTVKSKQALEKHNKK